MFFKIRLLFGRIADQLVKQKKMMILYVVWCMVCVVWREQRILQAYRALYHLELSVADILLLMQERFACGILITPITMFVILKCKQGSIQTQQIFRYKRRRYFYQCQIMESALYALLITGMLLLIETLTAYAMGISWVNWNRLDSLFFSTTKTVVEETFVKIFLGVFLMYLLKFLMNFLILELVLWKQRYMPIFWILILIQAGIENEGENVRFFHGLFSIQFPLWITPWQHVAIFLGGCIICAAIYFIGERMFRRRDIFH